MFGVCTKGCHDLPYQKPSKSLDTGCQQMTKYLACAYISSVYSSFSDRVGLPLHTIPSSGVLVKSIGAEFLRPDALPGVNHMHGM